jgi:hypothetical protein
VVKRFFRPRPARRGSLRLVITDLYRDALPDVSSGFAFDDKVLKAALKRIYAKDFHPMTKLEENLFNEFWDKLNLATDKGLGNVTSIDPDDDFMQALRYNNGVFAAFKTHRAQNDMAAMLLDENGKLKPFEQWLKDVQPIADHQCRRWFQTEYDTAVKRAHLAAEWQQFEQEADVLPNLEWVESTSITPGADHRIFWGIIRPINDPFWNDHRPGDRWGCKCGLRATDKKVTPMGNIPAGGDMDKPSPGLDSNPGKDGIMFNDTHPYFPPNCAACTLPGKREFFNAGKKNQKDCYHCLKTAELLKNAGVETPEALKYITYKKYKNGGEVWIHPDVNRKGSDYKQLITIANLLAKEGKLVKLTPAVHFKSEAYAQIYGLLANTPYYRKCPDLKIGNDFYEFESYMPPFKRSKISNMLSNGLKQSDKIIINNTKGASDRHLKRLIFERANRGINVDEVWVYERGKIRLLYKKQ